MRGLPAPRLRADGHREHLIGKYGRMRRAYLAEHRPALYSSLLLTKKLFPHLAKTDAACMALETFEAAMMRQEDVTETLKAADQMGWK